MLENENLNEAETPQLNIAAVSSSATLIQNHKLAIKDSIIVEKTIKRYETYNLSGLITILVKRLGDFAEAETHRDFNS